MSRKPAPLNTPIATCANAQTSASTHPDFDTLPDSAYVREAQLVRSPKRPSAPAPLPFSAATMWRKVKSGTFVQPTKLSDRVTAFNVGAIRAWIAAQTKA